MPTLNINGNIRTNTAAGWAADVTVYSAKTMLVTTDEFWGATDQHKFKLADGVQAWSNLDYPPFKVAADALSEVLAVASKTGETPITSDNTFSYVSILNAYVRMTFDNGAVTGGVYADPSYTEVGHDVKVRLNTPNVELPQETASLILSTDGNKYIKGLATTTYPSLTELSYVKGATSSIQTQLNGKKGIVMTFWNSIRFSPADSTTYFFTQFVNSGIDTLEVNSYSTSPIAFTITSAYGVFQCSAGSNENVTVQIGVNGVFTNITTVLQLTNSGPNSFNNGALNIAVALGDQLTIKMTTPAWVTNPTNLRGMVNLYGI